MSSKKDRFAALKAQFTKPSGNSEGGSSNNNYYPFWEMQVGQSSVIRFLPDKNENNPLGFLIKKMYHEFPINGEKKKIACLKQYDPNAECPICKASQQYYKSEGKESVNGKKYYRKVQYVGHALIIEDPLPANAETGETYKNTTKYVNIGPKIYESIHDAWGSGEFEESPDDYKEGTNFIIKKTQSGDWADYSRSKFQNKPSSLDDDTIAIVEAAAVDLSTLLPANPGFEKVEAMFKAALNGVDESDASDDTDDEDVPSYAPPKASKPTGSLQDQLKNADDGDVDEEAEAILAAMRANRSNRAK